MVVYIDFCVCPLCPLRPKNRKGAQGYAIMAVRTLLSLPHSQLGILRFGLCIYDSFATNAMVAMVRHGRAPNGGAANGSISASTNFVTSSLKSTNIDADMHVHVPMQFVGFPTYQDGEATTIWAFPWPATRCDLGRCHWSTVQMNTKCG